MAVCALFQRTRVVMLCWRPPLERELITPALTDGTILPGVTRDSILALSREWAEFKVTEGRVRMADLVDAIEEGRLLEMFGSGTAAVISPIKKFRYADQVGRVLAIRCSRHAPCSPPRARTHRGVCPPRTMQCHSIPATAPARPAPLQGASGRRSSAFSMETFPTAGRLSCHPARASSNSHRRQARCARRHLQ